MTIDFTQPVLFDAANTGYMVTMKELPQIGAPNYEVLEGYPNWSDIQAWLAAGNTAQPYVPTAPVAIPPAAAAAQQVQALIPQMIDALIPANATGLTPATLALIQQWQAARKAAAT